MSARVQVLLWRDVPDNPEAIPGDWPAEVLDLPDGERPKLNYVAMTRAEYTAHLATQQAAHDAWLTGVSASAERVRLAELIKSRAYDLETAGLTVLGVQIDTARSSQSMLGNALQYLTLNPAELIQWQGEDGSFTELGLDQIRSLVTDVGAHVQAHFTRRKELSELLATTADVDLPAFEATILTFYAG